MRNHAGWEGRAHIAYTPEFPPSQRLAPLGCWPPAWSLVQADWQAGRDERKLWRHHAKSVLPGWWSPLIRFLALLAHSSSTLQLPLQIAVGFVRSRMRVHPGCSRRAALARLCRQSRR